MAVVVVFADRADQQRTIEALRVAARTDDVYAHLPIAVSTGARFRCWRHVALIIDGLHTAAATTEHTRPLLAARWVRIADALGDALDISPAGDRGQ